MVVDDHPLFRFGLRPRCPSATTSRSSARPPGGQAAIAPLPALKPDVVVMDLHMPDLGGVDATRAITNGNPAVGVLVLTMFDDSESVFNAMRAGARGYLLKGAEPEELVRAVHAVARGEAIFGQSIAAQVLRYFNGLNGLTRRVLPRAHRARARGARTHRGRPQQLRDRPGAVAVGQDRPQPRLDHLRQAAGGRPGPGDRPGPGGRPRDSAPAASVLGLL